LFFFHKKKQVVWRS